jgi:enolase
MKIENIRVNKILDSRGEETIEVEILSEEFKEKASVPIGKSLGKHEAICLDCGKIEKNLPDFLENVKNFDFQTSKEFDNFLIERAGKNKEKLGANFTLGASIAFARVLAKKEGLELWEYLTEEYTKQHENIAKQHEKFYVPCLVLNIIGGGVHSFNNLDFQEYWLIADLRGFQHGLTRIDINNTDKCGYNADERGYFDTQINADFKTDLRKYFDTLLAKILNIINKLEEKLPKPLGRNDEGAFCTNFSDNYEPFLYLKEFVNNYPNNRPNKLPELNDRIDSTRIKRPNNIPEYKPNENQKFGTNSGNEFGIDSGSEHSFGHDSGNITFQLGADIAANQITKLVNWERIYEKLKLLDVKYLEDPFKEDEFENFANLRKQGFKVIGDDLTVTNVERLKIALEKNSVDGVIVKPNQVGTILETFEFVKLAKENDIFTIFSHRSGETNDHWLIDLGIAFKTDFFKIGPPLQGERVAKYNRLREILKKICII